jgi:hypothetical protein
LEPADTIVKLAIDRPAMDLPALVAEPIGTYGKTTLKAVSLPANLN